MSGRDSSSRARQLAEEFDRAFALPERNAKESGRPALAIRAGSDAYVLPLDGLAAVSRRARIVALPGAPPAQVGVAGIRGGLVAVFSLPALLGYDVPVAELGWLAVTAGPRPLAFGFEVLEGQISVVETAVVAAPTGTRRHVSDLVRFQGDATTRGLLDTTSILARVGAASTGGG